LTKAQKQYLDAAFPDVQFVETKYARSHGHTLLALTRQVTEQRALDHLGRLGCGTIADVGGNAVRHHQQKRVHVWSLNPVLDAADVIRSRKVSDDVTLRCQHILQECPHINTADGLMFIHSLYYFSHPQDILNALRRTRRGIAVSVHHVFHRPRGDFCLRECSYQTKNDRVVMTVHGETPSYSHGSLRWVHQSNYYADERGSLIWKPFSHTPDAELVEFHLGPVMPGATLPRPVGLRAVVRDDEFIGEVDLRSPLNESPTMLYTTEEIALSLQLTNAYSWREGLVLGVAEQPVDIFVPKSFIFDIATQVMGMERSATTHRTLMGWAKRRIDRFNIPHDERPLVLNVAVTLGFMLYAEQETRVLTTYIAPQVDMLADHSRALAFDFPWRPKPWLVAAAAAVGIGLSFYEPKDPTPACFTLGPQRWTGDLILRARATLAWFRQFDAGNLRDWWRGRPASTTAGSFGVAIARALGGSRLRTVLRWAFRAASSPPCGGPSGGARHGATIRRPCSNMAWRRACLTASTRQSRPSQPETMRR
jgi:hypothetical protein